MSPAQFESGATRASKVAFETNIQANFEALHSWLAENSLIHSEADLKSFNVGDFFELDVKLETASQTRIKIMVDYFSSVVDAWGRMSETERHDVQAIQSLVNALSGSTYGLEANINRPTENPVGLVSHLDSANFWRDAKLVMTAGRQVTVLCRARSQGLTEDWDALPLQGLLKGYGLDLKQIVDGLEAAFFEGLANPETSTPHVSDGGYATPADGAPPDDSRSQVQDAIVALGLQTQTSPHAPLRRFESEMAKKALVVDVIAIYW